MASCAGKKNSRLCGSRVYNCSKCTNLGCDQFEADECSNQGFRSGTCIQCGAVRIASEMGLLVMTPRLREAIRRLRWMLPDE